MRDPDDTMPDDLSMPPRLTAALDAMRQAPQPPTRASAEIAARAVLASGSAARSRRWGLRVAAALVIAALGAVAGAAPRHLAERRAAAPMASAASGPVTPMVPVVASEAAMRPIVFELDAPRAHQVQVLGDFNGWSRDAARMERSLDGHWRMTTLLPPGRYVYAYLVDGQRFQRDPQRDASEDRDFGVTGSELVVGEAP